VRERLSVEIGHFQAAVVVTGLLACYAERSSARGARF
jgi:hypothetical protein